MDKLRIAFRRSLEQGGKLSDRTIQGYVTAAGRLMRFCEGRGEDVTTGDIAPDTLPAFHASLPASSVRRIMRGVTLFLEFLEGQGVPIPEQTDDAEPSLTDEDVERFIAVAAEEPEPFATLLCLLAEAPLSARRLRALEVDAIQRDEEGLVLAIGDELVRPHPRAQRRLGRYLSAWRLTEGAPDASRVLFPREDGESLSGASVTRRLQAVQRSAELPVFRASALVEWSPAPDAEPPSASEEPQLTDGAEPRPTEGAPPTNIIQGPWPLLDGMDEPHEADSLNEARDGEDADTDDLSDAPDEGAAGAATPFHTFGDSDPRGRDGLDDDGPAGERSDSPFYFYAADDGGETRHGGAQLDGYDSPFRVYQGAAVTDRKDSSMGNHDDDDRKRRGGHRSMGRSRRAIDHLIPDHGSVALAYRPAGGRVTFIGTFNSVDIYAEDKSLVGFISRQLVPQYGGGTYLVYREAGDRTPIFEVEMAPPPGWRREPEASSGASPSMREIREMFDLVERMKQHIDPHHDSMLPHGYPPGPPGYPPANQAYLPGSPHPPGAPFPSGTTVLPASPSSSYEGFVLELLKSQLQRNPADEIRQLSEALRVVRDLEAPTKSEEEGSPWDRFASAFGEGLGSAAGKHFVEKTEAWLGSAGGPSSTTGAKPSSKPARPPKKSSKAPKRNDQRRRIVGRKSAKRSSQLPTDLPELFGPLADELRAAETEEELFTALGRAFASLHLDRSWRPHIQKLMSAVMFDRREEAIDQLMRILGVVVRLGHLDEDTARLVVSTADTQWDELRAFVAQQARQAQARQQTAPSDSD